MGIYPINGEDYEVGDTTALTRHERRVSIFCQMCHWGLVDSFTFTILISKIYKM